MSQPDESTATRPGSLRALALVALGVAAIAVTLWLQWADSTYFEMPSSISLSGPARLGERAYVGVGVLEIKPGDRVRLVSLDAGPAVTRALAASLKQVGEIGVINETFMPAGELDRYQALPTTEWSEADSPVGLVVEILTPATDVTITRPELTFVVNNGPPQRVHLFVAVRICAVPATDRENCTPPEPPR
jgi:hypothetical protein